MLLNDLFLHELGYTYLDIPKLTIGEINNLVNAQNLKIEDQERLSKSIKSKRNRGLY